MRILKEAYLYQAEQEEQRELEVGNSADGLAVGEVVATTFSKLPLRFLLLLE